LAELQDPGIVTLVAVEAEGALTAYAQVWVHRPVPSGHGDTSAELWRFYVDRPWLGQGLATQLMSAVRELAIELRCDALWLAVWEHNPRAIAFYNREGFRQVGSQPFQLGDDLQTDLVMVTSLTRTAAGDRSEHRATGNGVRVNDDAVSTPSHEPDEGWHRLDSRYVTMARQAALLELLAWCVGLGLITALLWWLLDWSLRTKAAITAVWLSFVVLRGVIAWIIPPIHYRHAAWRLGERGLEIRGGAWWRHATRMPRSRIQHTDVSQGPLERRHGLGTLVAYTAGSNHSAVALAGVAYADALAVRDQLLHSDAADSV
jgi:membrane protein YdbS with pleckstrin-like domain